MDEVVVTRANGIVTLRLNRPAQLNALDAATGEALIRHGSDAMSNPDVDCIVVTGTGRAFSGRRRYGFDRQRLLGQRRTAVA